jgi:peptide/nickel transport system permease protein
MGTYILRRFLQAIVILAGVSVLVFILVNLIPGNPYYSMFSPETPTEQIETILWDLGYYDPLPVKYLKWAGRALRGDFGYSIFYRDPVMKVITSRLGNTVLLSLVAIVISTILGISLGIFTARRRNGSADTIASIIAFLLLSMPVFFLGMLMIKIFAVNLRLLPISGMVTVHRNYRGIEKVIDILHHMILPALILGLYYAVTMFRYTRSSVYDVLRADYIRAARAHGIPERVVMYRHTLKNAMIPIVTVLSLQIPSLLSGALITETVFLWPGVGRLSYEAVNHRDYPLVMGILLIMACITLVSNLLADIAYAAIDQRVTFDDSKIIR